MRKEASYKGGRRFLIDLILFIAVISLLWACDSGGNGGNGGCNGDDPTPTVTDENPLIPDASWDCGMPDGIPSPESGTLVFEAEMSLGSIYDMGQTQYGRRHVIEVTGGTVSGPDISAEVLGGGLDYQLTLSNGAMEIEQINVLKTSDGSYIYFRNCGASADDADVRIVPDFEAPNKSAYSFLNTGKFAGTRELDEQRKIMKLKIYDVSNVTVDSQAAGAVRVTQPDDVPDQSWECREATSSETKGDVLLRETVTLSDFVTVGASKYGTRNISPITGGTIAKGGKIAGKVLPGGGDYQIFGGEDAGIYIDARYTLETDDGELIIIRNCGPLMKPAPSFETRADGNYSFLNDARYLSSFPVPSLDISQVRLTLYEVQ